MQLIQVALAVFAALGVMASIYSALRLVTASRVVNERSLMLEGLALLLYAIGLAVETILVLVYGAPMAYLRKPHWRGRQVLTVSTEFQTMQHILYANLVAGYLYIASYAIHAASLYSLEAVALTLTPLAVASYNVMALFLLTAICYALVTLYRATIQAIIYHIVLIASHIVSLIAATSYDPILAYAGILVRCVAPLMLVLRISVSRS